MTAPRTRLTRLTVSNYRSLGAQTTVELDDLTVLAGINSSGKSNVLSALGFLALALDAGLPSAVGNFATLRRDGAGREPVTFNARFDGEDGWFAEYNLILTARRKTRYVVRREAATVYDGQGNTDRLEVIRGIVRDAPEGFPQQEVPDTELLLRTAGIDKRFQRLAHALRSIRTYSIDPHQMRVPHKASLLPFLDQTGSTWASFIEDALGDGYNGALLTQVLQRATEDIVDLRSRAAGDFLQGQFGHDDGGNPARTRWFPASRESDGTLRLAGLGLALLQNTVPTLIALEEPEQTLHPGAIGLLMDLVRTAAERSQVMLTTHSPDLLNHVDATEIRVVRRSSGTTTVAHLAEHQLAVLVAELQGPGDLLRSEGLAQAEREHP